MKILNPVFDITGQGSYCSKTPTWSYDARGYDAWSSQDGPSTATRSKRQPDDGTRTHPNCPRPQTLAYSTSKNKGFTGKYTRVTLSWITHSPRGQGWRYTPRSRSWGCPTPWSWCPYCYPWCYAGISGCNKRGTGYAYPIKRWHGQRARGVPDGNGLIPRAGCGCWPRCSRRWRPTPGAGWRSTILCSTNNAKSWRPFSSRINTSSCSRAGYGLCPAQRCHFNNTFA